MYISQENVDGMSSSFTSWTSDNLNDIHKNLLESEAAEDKMMFPAEKKKAENRVVTLAGRRNWNIVNIREQR